MLLGWPEMVKAIYQPSYWGLSASAKVTTQQLIQSCWSFPRTVIKVVFFFLLMHPVRETLIVKYYYARIFLFPNDIKIGTGICLGDIPIIQNEQYTTATSPLQNTDQQFNCMYRSLP